MSDASKVNGLFKSEYNQMHSYIDQHFDNSLFESFVVQKGFEKIYRLPIEETTKQDLFAHISLVFNKHTIEANNFVQYINSFFPISDSLYAQLKEIIVNSFEDSLAQFYYYLGQFVFENPLTIGTAKQIVIKAAKEVLSNDLASIGYMFSIDLTIDCTKSSAIERCYLLAVELGALREKYDAICFEEEEIESIITNPKPVLTLRLKDPGFEYGLQFGSAFHSWISKNRFDQHPGVVQQFYKCVICKYCALMCIDDTSKDISISLLERQFAVQFFSDVVFYHSDDIPAFLLSVITYLYTNLLLLVLCSSKTMQFFSYKTVRKEMLWGNRINDEDFNMLIHQFNKSSMFQNWIQSNNEGFIIGRWQFDYDLCIPEVVNRIAFNSQSNSKLGTLTDTFGKTTYEKIIRRVTNQYGWKTIPHSIKIKENGRILTDVDLIAFRSGVVIVGQIKVASCGRTPFEIWKAKQTISKALVQAQISAEALNKDQQLLFSILKKHHAITSKKEIKAIVPLIITRSSFYIGMGQTSGIATISLDMFHQIMGYLREINDPNVLAEYIKSPFSLYNFPVQSTVAKSVIEQEKYTILYEEVLGDDATIEYYD